MDYVEYCKQLKNQFYLDFIVWVCLSILLAILCSFAIYLLVKRRTKWDIIGLILLVIFMAVSLFQLHKYMNDFSLVKKNEIYIATGTAISTDAQKSKDTPGRYIRFRIDDGAELNLNLYYGQIYEGDRFEIVYLPNTGHAVIVQKLKSKYK